MKKAGKRFHTNEERQSGFAADRDHNAALKSHRAEIWKNSPLNPFEPLERIPCNQIALVQVLSGKQEARPQEARGS